MRTDGENWGCSACRRGGSRETLEHLRVPKGGLQENWGETFYKDMQLQDKG